MVNANRPSVVVLSRFGFSPYEFPADVGDLFPPDATAHCVFSDTEGTLVADITGTVTPDRVRFLFAHSDVVDIKRGFNFEVYLNDTVIGGEYMIRYGKVVRREATFEYVAASVAVVDAIYLTGDFTIGRVGQPSNKYAQVLNNAVIYNNPPGVPNALGTDIENMFDSSAVRYRSAVGTDSARMQVLMVPGGAGKTRVGFCANMSLTNYIGVEFDGTANTVKMCTGTGPLDGPYHGATGTDTIASSGTYYTLDYNNATKQLTVTKAGDDTPLMTPWVDESNLVVHGQGYRYPFFSFNGSVLATGPQVGFWEIQDYVGA